MPGEALEQVTDVSSPASHTTGATTLVLSPAGAPARRKAVRHALAAGTPGNTQVVAATHRPAACVDRIRSWAEWPAGTSLLALGDGDVAVPEAVDVTAVPPEDATTITAAVEDRLAAAAERTRHTVFVFESVSRLVEDVGVRRSFRFLDGLTTELADAEVTAQFHLDPDAHRRRTVLALRTLFDDVARSPDGDALNGHALVPEPSD